MALSTFASNCVLLFYLFKEKKRNFRALLEILIATLKIKEKKVPKKVHLRIDEKISRKKSNIELPKSCQQFGEKTS